jgi:hypothetical protein
MRLAHLLHLRRKDDPMSTHSEPLGDPTPDPDEPGAPVELPTPDETPTPEPVPDDTPEEPDEDD